MLGKNSYLQQSDPDPDALHSHASTSIVGLLTQHHHTLLSAHTYLPPGHPTPLVDPAAVYGTAGDGVDPSPTGPKTPKKDRHSKINTAQGPRDRRVRLSIGVARKFFDLQEVLGFDKPSKTLDWLLTKSKSAIKHLVTSKTTSLSSECHENNNNNSNSLTDQEEPPLPAARKGDKKGKSSKRNKGGVKDAQQQAALNMAKESRVKARARARERTREKMCIKQQMENNIHGYHDLLPAHSYMNSQLEAYELDQDLIRESDAIKRKVNRQPLSFGFHHPAGYSVPYSLGEGWDIGNYSSQSSLSAILDHHKFNISSSND